jgi:serine-type D-Ala-D-Ala carboxypeptidase/endopeptidase (penicillin-binding protein 4)
MQWRARGLGCCLAVLLVAAATGATPGRAQTQAGDSNEQHVAARPQTLTQTELRTDGSPKPPIPTPAPDPLLAVSGDPDSGPPLLPAPSWVVDLPQQVDERLPALALDPSQVSVYVRQVDADRPYLTYNADQPRIPASVAKLITSIVGLDSLGPAHRWHTEVLISGSVRDGRLIGDLYIKGYGDPYLTSEAYAALIRAIRAKGIEHIDGDLVFDDSQLLPPTAERGDFDGAAQRSYNALPAALSVNRQVTDIHIYNNHQNGRVGIYTEPPLSAVDIVNEAKVVTAPCKGRFHRLTATFVEPEDGLPQLKVAGNFASECPEEQVRRLILSPEQHAAAAFDALWRQLGGSIGGRVLLGSVPADAQLLHSAQSQPLGEIIRTINKYSDNLMARMLFLEIGMARDGPPGSVDKSRAALADWLTEHEFDFPGFYIDNGSGLSRDTRISAAALGELLFWAYQQPWMPELMASLAIMGVDGTLTKRMRREPIEGRAHLKTGTVRDASCIAGYVLDAEGHRWVVVVLVNAIEGQTLQAWRGHAVHHDLLRWVYDGARLPDPHP